MRRLLVTGLVGILVLFVAIGAIAALQTHLHQSALQRASNTFVADILADNATSSYNLFTSNTQTNTGRDAWATQVKMLSSFFKGSSPHHKGLTKSPTIQLATYTIGGADGTYTFSVTLIQEAKSWHVQSFNSELQ